MLWSAAPQPVARWAHVPDIPEIRERLPPEGRELLEERERVRERLETAVDTADADKLNGGVRGEEDVRRDPVGRLPLPFGVGGTNELTEVWTPVRKIELRVGKIPIVRGNERRRVPKLKLPKLGSVCTEEGGKALPAVVKLAREDGEVRELRHLPRGEDGE